MIDQIVQWLQSLQWSRLVPEILGKGLGVVAGILISWWLLFRKRMQSLDRLQRGDSDDLLFQAHYLIPLPNECFQLVFRNVAPRQTIETAYDNPIAQDELKRLSDQTTLAAPILLTQGRIGFEILNDAAGILSGFLATSPMPRRVWLFCMTCEDRAIVRKECIRCFLISEPDLKRFADWQWCRQNVFVERPWHWFRIVALHRIARYQQDELLALPIRDDGLMPLVDEQRKHRRLVPLSLGLIDSEAAVGPPMSIDWPSHEAELSKMGLAPDGHVLKAT
jgi:hypothetical protein